MKLNNYFLLYNVNSYITYLITLEIFKYLSKDSELLRKKEKNFENSYTLDTFSISSQLLHKNSTRFRFISCQHKEETHSTAPQKRISSNKNGCLYQIKMRISFSKIYLDKSNKVIRGPTWLYLWTHITLLPSE